MLFKSKQPDIEQYELVNQNVPTDDPSNDISTPNSSEDDTKSVVLDLFEDIDMFQHTKGAENDDFNENSTFQLVVNRYRGIKPISKIWVLSISTAVMLLWLTGLIIYSNSSAKKIIQTLQWNTDLVAYNGENVTLNHYDVHYKNVTMTSYQRGAYFPYEKYVQWLKTAQYPSKESGGYYMSRGRKGSFIVRQLNTNYEEQIFDDLRFEYKNNFFEITDVILNPNRPFNQMNDNVHIVVTDKQYQWRHLSFAIYWLFSPVSNSYTPIQPTKQEVLDDEEQLNGAEILEKLHFVEFSPKGDHIVFGFDHNLYIQPVSGDKKHKVTRITDSGTLSYYNGKPDWVYEEEVIPSDSLIWWSPDQENLFYASINDTDVMDYSLDYYVKDPVEVDTVYEEPDAKKVDGVNQYPIKTSIKYPKPGTPNPVISLKNYKLSTGITTDVKQIDSKLGKEFILYDVAWIDNDNCLLKLSDRTSTILSKKVYKPGSNTLVDVSSINTTEAYSGWVEKISPVTIIPGKDTKSYVDKVVVHGRVHLALFDSPTSPSYSKLLTDASDWDVVESSPVVYNEHQNQVYFLSTVRSNMDTTLVSVDLTSTGEPTVITGMDEDGKYNIQFSENGQYLDLRYAGPSYPWQRLLNMEDVHDFLIARGNSVKKTGANEYIHAIGKLNSDHLNDFMKSTNSPTRLYKKVKVGKYDDGSPIFVNMIEILPPNFNPNFKRKYPLFVNVYGGPGSTTVDKTWQIDFQDIVSATLDAVVLIIDPRGTGEGNWRFKSFSRGNIGRYEPQDLITVVSEYISVNKKFIDKFKTSLWGWSYGGFTTLKTLEVDAGKTFKFGMAVAPVTNWLFYDSIYTERYMGLPSESYDKWSKISDFRKFKEVKRFLIMHGTGDDNVHLQNSLWLLDNLNIKGVENYDVHFFPDSDHSIYYHNAHNIIFDKLLRWTGDAFNNRFDDL